MCIVKNSVHFVTFNLDFNFAFCVMAVVSGNQGRNVKVCKVRILLQWVGGLGGVT